MRFKLTFFAGLASGYVLGAKAGRKRYDSIAYSVRRLVDSPVVQEAAGVMQAQASGAIATAKNSVSSRVSDKVTTRISGYRSGKFFTASNGAPAYPQAAHEEFGADS